MSASATPSPALPAWLPPDELLRLVVDMSVTGLIFYTPIYDPADGTTIVDFRFELLNAAAQRMMRMPERPTLTHNQQWPHSKEHGTFDFHVEAYRTDEPREYKVNYQADGYDNFYHLVARRAGPGLLVSFTDTADQPRSPVEVALRESQAREQAARADAEAQRQQLHHLLMQAPASIASMEGPELVFTLVNPLYQQLVGSRQLLGKPLRQAWPELEGQGFLELLEGVYRTGETYFGNEQVAYIDRQNTGRPEAIYFNFIYQAARDAAGTITGVFIFAYDVTEQVLSRRRVEEQEQQTNVLNEELAATNEELYASNEEVLANNEELVLAQQELRLLNADLETRVAARTAELRLAQLEEQRQRTRLERFFMQAPAAICVLDGPELVFELVNPAYQALFPGRPLLGRPLLQSLPELAGHHVFRTLRQVYHTGITHQEDSLLVPIARTPDGPLEDRYFNYIYQARFDEHGRIDGVLVFAFEVTEQVLARQASEAGRRRLRLLTDALPVLIGYVDQQQRYQFANQAYQAWFNQDPAALLDRPVEDVVGPTAYAGVRPYIQRALAGEQVDFDARMPYRADFVRHIHTSYVPDVQDGQVLGFYSLVTDITDQVRAREQVQDLNEELAAINEELQASNEELLETNQQLTRSNVDLDNFIYTASHDLKAPISNIEGLLYALGEELPAEVSRTGNVSPILSRMLDSVNRFKRTISHLTEVSKLQKEHAPATEPVDLALVIDDVRLDLEPLLRETHAELVLDVAGCPSILFPEKNLRSVVYNLLSNALKYHAPDRPPRVELRCHSDEQYMVMEVRDNGLGIEAAQLPRLFAMFQRFHDHVEGSGIGLYMVKKMVENAGGRIEVRSQPGLGTTFSVYFKLYSIPSA
ncbi:PAS domain-containing protein [Hymenobacter chitinivorans]|uniref:histidine kinase n=1 Tax=Hymenobacter chitinivorans DSM 11115 TaxID=1121954 RepID=A0A2M9BSD7_9BACT|nr:PAS domain-containing protein [Hymenobacter chitinivorans]PJJ60858.1 PAS domain S-box-containing protein [Hymenobacter chitinivorans DSM 11115]